MSNEGRLPEGRIEWLDSLRALAALWVIAHHAAFAAPFEARGLLGVQIGRFLAHGTLAVTAFIALSGFSLGRGAFRNGWRLRAGYGEFLRARAIRIWPPYAVAIVLTLVLTLIGRTAHGEGISANEARTLGVALLKHLFLLQDLDGTNLIDLPGWTNGVFWTIGVEFKIYLLYPLMLAAIRRGGLLAGAVSAGAFALAFALLPGLKLERKPGFIVVFFLGVLACAFADRVPRRLAPGLVFLALGIGFACLQTRPESHQLPRDLVFGTGFCGLLASVGSLPRLKAALDHAFLATIGTFAYSLYLVHGIVVLILAKALPWRLGGSLPATLGFVAVAATASILSARGFFTVAERPFFRRRHLTAGNPEASSPAM